MRSSTATLIGLVALLLWSSLAALTVATGSIPAFQLLAMTFAIGALAGMAGWLFRPTAMTALRQRPVVWLVGVAGLFGYHALYFLALRFAPAAEAGLLNYLWPLLIVLMSAWLPGERLAVHHVIGALLGFAGVVMLFGGDLSGAFQGRYAPGFIAALCAAFVWASYSVLSRKFGSVPTDVVTGFCIATAVLATLVHLVLEPTVMPQTAVQWFAVIALGLGPVGLAFYAWDIGMKRGDIRLLGAASYATPLLSTLLLIVMGYAKPTSSLWLAALLIAGGGLLAAKDAFRAKR
jgi:drug/metabolite transporter (DMT)-like permease